MPGAVFGNIGASSFVALDDAASADLPAVNGPLGEALGAKSDLLAPYLLTADTNLTVGAHANRTGYIAGTGVDGTVQADAASGATSDEVFSLLAASGASGTLVAGAGVTFLSTTGTSLNTATAVSGWIAVQRVPYDAAGAALASTYKAISPAIVSGGSGATVIGLTSGPTSMPAGSAAHFEMGRIVVPAGTLADGAIARISGIWTKTGTTVNESLRVRVGENGQAVTAMNAALTAAFLAANGWLPFELMIVRVGSTIRGSLSVNTAATTTTTTANSFSLAVNNSTTAFDVAFVNGSSASDASNVVDLLGAKLLVL